MMRKQVMIIKSRYQVVSNGKVTGNLSDQQNILDPSIYFNIKRRTNKSEVTVISIRRNGLNLEPASGETDDSRNDFSRNQ